jgi:DNA helicase-2/ATP-dependent DNA helicase PcrA
MVSNFYRLVDVAPAKLFESISTAEKLFAEEHYHFVPTAIRSYCEGVMSTVLDINLSTPPVPSLSDMIQQFSYKFNKPHITSAANRIRKIGNKASHYKPHQWSRNDLDMLFKDAMNLYNFLIIDFYGIKVEPQVLSLEILSSHLTTEKQLQDEKLRNLAAQVELNSKLAMEIDKFQRVNRELKQKIFFYETDYQSKQQELEILAKREKELKDKLKIAFDLKKDHKEVQEEVLALQSQKNDLDKDIQFYEQKLAGLRNDEITLLNKNLSLEQALLTEVENIKKLEELRSLPSLSAEQYQLINIDSGKHLLEAPPGAGKTTILTHRLKNALEKYEDDNDIICLTFTTRAAEEMKTRAQRVLNGRQPFIGNFHNFCLNRIRESQNLSFDKKKFGILDDEYRDVILNLAKESAIQTRQCINVHLLELNYDANAITKVHSSVGFNRVFLDAYILMLALNEFDGQEICTFFKSLLEVKLTKLLSEASHAFDKANPDVEELLTYVWSVFHEFRKIKDQSGSYDFDDILCIGLKEIFISGDKKKYIQIDEVQDLSPLQWEIINAISDESSHVFCVGDIYQSIYGFLGADIEAFEKRTSQYTRHELKNNFRSDKNIVDLLSAYRKYNWRLPELTGNSEVNDKQSTLLLGYPDNLAESHNIALIIEKILNDSTRQVGLLCSNNKIASSYCDLLSYHKITFFRVSEHDLMQSEEIQDWMSCLRAYQGIATNRDWWRLIYRFAKQWNANVSKARCIKFINQLKSEGITVYDILQSGTLGECIVRKSQDSTYNYNLKELVTKYEGDGVVIFDTETTGLDFESDKIVQIAAIKVVNGVIVEQFERYVHLDLKSDSNLKMKFESSQQIHKIETHKIEDGQQLNQVLLDFFEFVGNCAVVAHNLTFDETMLKMNINNSINNYRTLDAYHKFQKNVQMDSLSLARQHFPNQQSYKLESLLKDFNLEGVNSHNALDDVKATASLLSYLMETIKPKISFVDSVLEQESNIAFCLRRNWVEVERFMGDQTINGRSSLADMLESWLLFIKDKHDWYKNYTIVSKEATEKLIPWLEKNADYVGLLNNLVDIAKPSVAKLFTLKEVDLIDEDKHRVIVSTIHRAKGLEFETVIVPQVVKDSFPPWVPNSTPEHERESRAKESQRLLYVALSRPKNKLIVTYHERQTPNGYAKGISPFIEGIRDNFCFSRT